MAIKQTSKLTFPGVTEDEYEIFDAQARQDAQSAVQKANNANSTAQSALSVANGKLKTVTLKTSYADDTKTLSITLQTSTS